MIGKTISHYKIIEKLGEGGMGVVYKAEDTKLKRTVALKFLPADLTRDQEAKDRFMHEARAASSLDHPNICNIHEIDETEDGQLFLAMACYEGQTLNARIAGQASNVLLRVDDAVNITIQIAEGLAKAHEKEIVHRDLKPANIMITDDGIIKILDFGLAKLVGKTKLTKEGTTLGTTAYMSPEQTQGTEVDHRTDIWALGVALYEMLTGKQPFRGDYEQAVMYSILHEEPEPITGLRTGIPMELERIVNKCLQKEPATRYQRVDELLVDLRQVQSAQSGEKSVVAGFKPATTRTMLTTNKWKILFLGIASLVLLTVAGYLFFGREAESSEPIPIAVVSFENMTGDTTYNYLQKAIPNLLITSLEQSPNLQVATWERLRDLLKQTGKEYVEVIDKDLGYELCRMDGINTIVVGSFTKAGNAFTTEVRILDISSKRLLKGATANGSGEESILLNQVDELSTEISKGVGLAETRIKITQRPIAEVTTASMQAYNYFLRGREYFEKYYYADATRLFKRAVELDSTFATAHLYLARLYSNFDRRLAIQAYEKAMAYSGGTPEKERLFIESYYARTIERNPEKADSILQQVVQKYPKEKRMRHALARRYRNKGQYEKAIDEFNKVLDLDPNFTDVYNQLGYTYASMGDFGKGIESLKRYASLSPGDANPFDSMAEVYLLMGNVDAAIANFEEVLAIKPNFPNVSWRLSYCHALKENYAEIAETFAADEKFGKRFNAYIDYYLRGFYQYFEGCVNEALKDLQRASQLADSLERPGWKAVFEELKGWIYYDLGEFDAGRIAIKKSIDYRMEVDPKGETYHKSYHSFYLGLVNVKLGQIDSAKYHLEVIKAVLPQAEREQNEQPKFHYDLLRAEILMAEGSLEKAIAVRREIKYMKLSLGIPQAFVYNLPFRDDIAARAFQQQGNIDAAIAEYERLTIIDPKSNDRRLIPAPFHYRLAKLYERKGLTTKAIARYEHFLKVWKNADEDLPELIDAKARLAKLRGSDQVIEF